ncbi:MAG: hypothetical protein A3G33_06370 [Omnitrophica bacterium RIFCSPLOWO2_12_FULL_44_17]|uniref:Prephenate/arogenate dehydrogenase domain-containing protein n=1 Tax=Candidatus Danuiimicrobium aquiferis TaxID=1801832 RepID=A0A1G1L1H9_9BACT|nr:MAG: hypothetical protein A3B72_01740 [Omnitrophica bacterium RIFCSPHIGHO2_02_FULL_45_28]OGW89952.1 MAG: hypothetical protein A3E74_03200 [Omnitrophica bacterium RIFCSPHIGHO2_12_FULL_44_12]OGW99002.1 MAG: hypothetical protein A3G33_06370 [Omnitrophica bacterium RIFCSPLOWO2_12_FULL_44_17]OGX04181.1 MAG: hypothetical protein A3J12_03305 [Omnitrophica bacterium RIFCSPLOWO2_02_FULL_44_11]
MKQQTFVIVGLGLMGGSLAVDLRKNFPSANIVGISRHEKKILYAKKKKIINEGFVRIETALKKAHVIFLCSPVGTLEDYISKIDCFAEPGTVVTDVGSTKFKLVNWTDHQRFKNIKFVGSHPLAGSHLRGVEHAIPSLYKNALVFVTPTHQTNQKALQVVVSIWEKLKAQVKIISPADHDKIVSEISHLPHALAAVLVNLVSSRSIDCAASGFLDTTRIAQGYPKLWVPIFESNRKNLIKDLKRYQNLLKKLICLLEKRSKNGLEKFLFYASERRSQLKKRACL